MARTNRDRVLHVRTSGKYGNSQYGLADAVGRAVKRADRAKLRSVAGLARRAPAMAKRAIVENYNIPASKITQRVRVRTTPVTLNLDASALRFALSEFGGRWGGRSTPGATAQVVRGDLRTYHGAFMAPGRLRGSQASLIYSRTGRFAVMRHGRYKGKRREIIQVNRGPSIAQMIVGHDQSGKRVGPDLRDALDREMVGYYIGELHRQYALDGA